MAKNKMIAIYYDPEEADLKRWLDELAALKGNRFENRKHSEIGRIALTEWLQEQRKKYLPTGNSTTDET